MTAPATYRGVVQKIILEGKHGSYAVAQCEPLGLVTFSLTQKVWKEKDRPEPGEYVLLGDLRRMRAGWRAKYGRFVQPSDEQ